MRKNKHIRVEDAPVQSVSTPVVTASGGGPRVFQIGDSSHEADLGFNGSGEVIASRLIIPFDNSEGTTPLAIMVQGFFQYYFSVPSGENLLVRSNVEAYWSDLNKDTQSESIVNLNYSGMWKTTILPGSMGYGGDGYGTVDDQCHFVASGIVAAGESMRYLFVELGMQNEWSSYSVDVDNIGPYATGWVVEDPQAPWPESYEGAPEDEPDNWPAAAGGYYGGGESDYEWTAGGTNYGTYFSWYNEL